MAFVLGAVTLPTPKNVKEKTIKTGSRKTGVTGKTYEDVMNYKKEFTLKYEWVTNTTYNAIRNEMINADESGVSFQVTEANWNSTYSVLIELPEANYNKGLYIDREFTLTLTEIE